MLNLHNRYISAERKISQKNLEYMLNYSLQNCSILSQNVPKFELYKHNDELFSMYDRIFYELWTFANFAVKISAHFDLH
jgi:hypothetical protein